MTTPGHVCDPGGELCPPWAHYYPSALELARLQHDRAAAASATRPPAAPPRTPRRPPSPAKRAADHLVRQLEDLARRGYELDSDQTARLARLIGI